jgi:putative spermidine/putrescine transport system permease protein
MRLSGTPRWLLGAGVFLTLAFIYIPLLVIFFYAFNGTPTLRWPPSNLTTHWFADAIKDSEARDAFLYSIKVGLIATGIALILGTLASLAVSRHRFFGRETISFLVVLPIALPGIVTGIALQGTFTEVIGIPLSLFTLVAAHATFCIVVVYNNTIARLRRTSVSFEEASADLGANPWQTFWNVTRPSLQTALVAGGLLAFALSFDEIIVTTFTIKPGDQTLPLWILDNLFRGSHAPIVNVVAIFVVVLSIIPVYVAHRLTREEGGAARRGRATVETTDATTVPAEATAIP